MIENKTPLFINKAILIHGDKYDYSLVKYINTKTKVKIICLGHGIFEQTPYHHIRGQGCPKCSKTKKLTTMDFIKKAKLIHGDKYDYSLVQYKNMKSIIVIICPKHGEFKQIAESHITQKTGCSKCSKKYSYSNDEFKEISSLLHNNKYDYSLTIYKNNHHKVKIICPEHGEFKQIPSNHLSGKGCQLCKESKGENIIKLWLDKNNIIYNRQHKFNNCIHKRHLSFDFYLPEHNICIEYNGIQHYKPINWFGNKNDFMLQQKRDEIKIDYCNKNNIKLITIKYNENINNILSKNLLYFD